jgi:hypothetical protein
VLDAPDANALFQSSIVRGNGLSIGDTIDQLDDIVTDVYGLHELALPSYSDQVLPFDITLAAANEYGAMCAGKILGVEILNEGSGISVDDAVSEASATFVGSAYHAQTRASPPSSPSAAFRIRFRGFWGFAGKSLLFSDLHPLISGDPYPGFRHQPSPSIPCRNCATWAG